MKARQFNATDDFKNNERSKQQPNVDRNQNGIDMAAGMSGNLMEDSAINFSVTTPVSGATLEDRPLLNALLSNEEYRAKYEGYLEEVATNYLTEEYIQSITKKLAVLLTTYVEADPTKFSTTEQFLEAVEGENSLPEFAKQRSASILKQLSGELVVEASTSQGNMGMPNPNDNGDMNGNPMPEDFDPSQLPSFNQDGNNQGERPAGGGPMQRPDQNGGPMGMPGQNNEQLNQATVIDKNTVITIVVCLTLLIVALLGVLKFKRRG